MKKIRLNWNQSLNIVYIIFLIMTTSCFIGICYNGILRNSHANSIQADDDLIDFNVGWYNSKKEPITLNYFTKNESFQKNQTQMLYHKIGNDVKPGDSICFRSLSSIITLYIDNKPVLTTPYKEMLFSCKSAGSVWSFYKFKKEDIGKELRMEVKLCYNDSSCYIENMYVGNPGTYSMKYLTNNIVSILATIITLFLGILFMAADIYINIAKPLKEHTLLHIGLFATHMAVWCLFSTHIVEFLFPGTSQAVQYVSCVGLFLIPYQTLFFVRSTFGIKKDKPIKIAGSAILFLYFIATVLQLTDLQDYHETLKLTHLALGIGIFTLIYTLTVAHLNGGINLFKMRKEKNRLGFMITTFFIVGFLIIGVIFDLILFYNGDQVNVGIFTRYSVIFVIIYLGLLASHNLFDIIKQLNDSELTRKLAYKDNLTNIANRTAFVRDFDNIKNHLEKHTYVGIVSFDVNNLKQLNDTLGHTAGDELIIAAANTISAAFESEFSSVYRIGGDEFTALIDTKDAEKIFRISEALFKDKLEEFNSNPNNPFNLSIAYGCAYYDASEGNKKVTLDDVLKKSDSLMYKHKAEIKGTSK